MLRTTDCIHSWIWGLGSCCGDLGLQLQHSSCIDNLHSPDNCNHSPQMFQSQYFTGPSSASSLRRYWTLVSKHHFFQAACWRWCFWKEKVATALKHQKVGFFSRVLSILMNCVHSFWDFD